MFIPLRHENNAGTPPASRHDRHYCAQPRDFSSALIRTIDQQAPELSAVKMQILLLGGHTPRTEKCPTRSRGAPVSSVQKKSPALWKEAQRPYRDMPSHTNEKIRLQQYPETLQDEMDSLSDRYAKLDSASILSKYAYTPAQPKIQSLLDRHLSARRLAPLDRQHVVFVAGWRNSGRHSGAG